MKNGFYCKVNIQGCASQLWELLQQPFLLSNVPVSTVLDLSPKFQAHT